MTIFQALVLGILQGLGEFLPISSSAHLALAPWLFGWSDPGLAFDVALHAGTLLAVLWYFRKEWIALIAAAWEIVRTRHIATPEQRRVILLIIATVPGAIGGALLEKAAETTFRSPVLIACALAVVGVLLWAVDRAAQQARTIDQAGYGDAIIFGLAQIAALIPGVSRSGATITAGRALRFDRTSAATFSFLMSMPIILGAVVLEGPKVLRGPLPLGPIMIGVIASAVSGLLAITILMRFLVRNSFLVFAVYRVLLAALVLFLVYAGIRVA